MNFYIVERAEMDQLSRSNDKAREYQSIAGAFLGCGAALIPQPFFMGYPTTTPNPYAMVVAWLGGAICVVLGLYYFRSAGVEKKAAKGKFDDIVSQSSAVSVPIEFSASAPKGN